MTKAAPKPAGLIDEGFYRVIYRNMPGVGCCRHRRTYQDRRWFEEWTVLVVHESGRLITCGVPTGSPHLAVGTRIMSIRYPESVVPESGGSLTKRVGE